MFASPVAVEVERHTFRRPRQFEAVARYVNEDGRGETFEVVIVFRAAASGLEVAAPSLRA
jgi:hypothetical protein